MNEELEIGSVQLKKEALIDRTSLTVYYAIILL